MDKWRDGWMDRWMERWMDRWIDILIDVSTYGPIYSHKSGADFMLDMQFKKKELIVISYLYPEN